MRGPQLSLVLPGDLSAAGEARAAVRLWLRIRSCSETAIETIELLASEVVGNAVRHAHGEVTMHVRMVGRRVRVDVEDEAPGRLPAPPVAVDAGDHGGRGLWLLNALSDGWGWEPTGAGKRVWFELPCPLAPAVTHDP